MSSEATRLAQLSVAVRESTLKRLRLVPVGREDWRPDGGALSFADITQHLIECDEWLAAKLADPGITAIKGEPRRAFAARRSEFQAFLDRLAETGEMRRRLLAGLGDDKLAELIPDERFGGDVSVWWVIVRGNLDHETHHRGQIAVYLRMVAAEQSPRGPDRDV
jgi:uncharacterized damage-inducible protein DinB